MAAKQSQYHYSHNNVAIITLFITCLALLTKLTTATGLSFSAELIQRDSKFSPTYTPSSGGSDRLRRSFLRAANRAKHFTRAIQSNPPIQSRIVPSEGEYLMNATIGTPPVQLLGIADTGSDLVWTQCKPCTRCFKQKPRLFDPARSSTYRPVSCDSRFCSDLPESACLSSSAGRDGGSCGYSYSYGDRSFTQGSLASETLTVGSASLSRIVFGCGHDNDGTFDESGSGLIGLGGGPLSLISQLGKSGNGKFSYCLVPLSAESNVTSKIIFGAAAEVSGPGVVSTPLVRKEPNTFYYLTLEAISVGEKRLLYRKNDNSLSAGSDKLASNQGNIIIDSGTTLTFLPVELHDELVAALSEAVVGVERVEDPSGVMSLCFRDGKDGRFNPPVVTAHFAGADVVLNPINTFARVEEGMFCFTVVPSDDVAIFGNLAQMNFLVGYDIERGTVSFKPTDCTLQ